MRRRQQQQPQQPQQEPAAEGSNRQLSSAQLDTSTVTAAAGAGAASAGAAAAVPLVSPSAWSPRDLTRAISTAATWQELRDLLQGLPDPTSQVNAIHISAALSRLVKLCAQDARQQQQQQQQAAAAHQQQQRRWRRPVVGEAGVGGTLADGVGQLLSATLLPLLQQQLPGARGRGLANIMWALAKLRCVPSPPLLAALLNRLDQVLPELQPQHHALVVYTLAQWQRQLMHSQRAAAAAAVASATSDDVAAAAPPPPSIAQPCPLALAPAASPRLHLRPAGPGGGGSAAEAGALRGLLGLHPARLRRLLAAAAPVLPSFGPQALSMYLYSLACLGVRPPPAWLSAFWAASEDALGQCSGQQLTNLLWAAARLQQEPPGSWLRAWLQASWGVLPSAAPQGVAIMAWSLASLGCWPGSAWLQHLLAGSAPLLPSYPEQALSVTCWALAQLAALPQAAGGADGSSLQVAALLRETGWLDALLAETRGRLQVYSPQQLSNTIWSLAALGLHPGNSWLRSYVAASSRLLGSFLPQELSNMLLALAKLGHAPGPTWLVLFEAASGQVLDNCRAQHLANMAWSFVRLGHQPSQAWMQLLLEEAGRRLDAASSSSSSSSSSGAGAGRSGRAAISGAPAAGPLLEEPGLGGAPAPAAAMHPAPAATWTDSAAAAAGPAAAAAAAVVPAAAPVAAAEAEGEASAAASNADAAHGLWRFNDQGLAMLAWALAQLRPSGDLPAQDGVWSALEAEAWRSAQQLSRQALATLLWAFARAGRRPGRRLVYCLLRRLAELRPGRAGREALEAEAMVLYALAALRVQPPLRLLLPALPNAQRLACSCQSSAVALWALARLGFHPGERWLGSWMAASPAMLAACSRRQLAMLAWSLVVLGWAPWPSWCRAWWLAWDSCGGEDADGSAVNERDLGMLNSALTLLAEPGGEGDKRSHKAFAYVLRRSVRISLQ